MAPTGSGMALNQDARMWSAYKELYSTVDAAINKKQPDAVHDLDVALRKHKPAFLSLLTNPARNTVYREDVKKATTEGLPIAGQQGKQILSQAFVDESLIISDLFDLNEFAAVELLIAGENQLPYFPGLTRGLVAVLLYYDGKRCLVNSLRSLMQAREGRTWTLDLNQDLLSITTKFTQQLIHDELTSKILEYTRDFELTAEVDKVQKQRGLGKAKHRKQVTDFIKEIRLSLAESLFNLACQTGLNRTDTLALIRHLKKHSNLNSDGTVDTVTLCLLMAALYCFDVSILETEDGEDFLKKLPILSDENYISEVHNEVTSESGWSNAGIKAILQFAWAQTLRSISQQSFGQAWSDYCEQDENIVETAIDDGAFTFMKEAIVSSDVFHNEEFYVRRLHGIITDFLVQMPLKVKELRNRGDETARIIMAHIQEGLQPPMNLPRHFEQMMILIGDFYYKDPLHLELSLEFWCPVDPTLSPGGGSFASRIHHRPPQRQISLYKFIRLAGDVLLPALYVPYIHMLRGLANGAEAAHHCYNLLKANGTSYGGQASTVSWDHFFATFNQYLGSLRQEFPSGMDTTTMYRPSHHRGITPQELDGLMAVLHLTRVIASQDESARVALCENQQWMAIFLFFGFLACSIPAVLKGEVLKTLAAFGKTAEIALTLWQSLESSQILPTVSSTSVHQSGGIKIELDEVEARNEEFPMTSAFMQLLGSLTDIPIPAGLGSGYRAPGFDPYLEFVRDGVFLKFNTRAYKNPAEKWEVPAGALELFHKLLTQYEMLPEDFIDSHIDVHGGGSVVVNKPPGYTLMVHLMNDGGLLKMVLFIIDEAVRNLDQYTTYPGKASMEKAALYCLKMIATVLNRQDQFTDFLRDGGSSALVSPLDKLLLGVNPRTAKADHMVNIVRYISHNSTNPEHALAAVQILYHVCQTPQVQQELVGLFTVSEDLYQNILHGFVECLEADDPEVLEVEEQQSGEDRSVGYIRNATRQSIMKLLLRSVDQTAPNIAHCLLGFELRKPVHKTNLQDPGVLRSPRTCLHSILSVLENGVGTRSGPLCLYDTPVLAELCYHLIYMLCANKDTSDPTMRYLRSTHDFFYRHLQHLPFPSEGEGRNADLILLQQSWLVKSIAIELRLTSVNRQRSNTQRLMKALLDDSPNLPTTGDRGVEQDMTHLDLDQSSLHHSQIQQNKTLMTGGQRKQKLLLLLETIGLSRGLEFLKMPLLEFFDREMIEEVIVSQEYKNDSGVRYCNVKSLHNLMMTEVNNLQGSAAPPQRRPMIEEIQLILEVVVKRNNVRETLFAKKSMFDAWRHVVEILLTACPVDVLAGEERQSIIFELLQDLFMEVSSEDAVPELNIMAASVILTLLANLRQCFMRDELSEIIGSETDVVAEESTSFGQKKGSRTLFASSLQVVLKGLIDHILRTSGGLQRVRANLYGALLYCLQIAQKPVAIPSIDIGGREDQPVLSRISSRENECDKLMKENLETILGYGDNFMEVVCRDACDGHEVGRMLALSALDAIISSDKSLTWLAFMQSKGYLQHLIDSLLHEDEKLQAMLSPNPEPLKALYIYESKMSLLTRLAGTATGANALLRCGLMTRLAECCFLDLRPDVPSYQGHGLPQLELEGFVPTILARYRQLLFPALKVCLAIMTSLGVENRDAANQVLKVIAAHGDVFNAILRERHTTLNLASLQELALVTAVISRAASDGDDQEYLFKDSATIEMQSQFSRIQRQLLSLLPRYCTLEKVQRHLKNMDSDTSTDGKDPRGEIMQAFLEISCNVLTYCRSVVARSAPDAKHCRILFGPSLTEVMSRDMHGVDELQSSITGAYRPPNLGVIIIYLKQYTDHFIQSMDHYKQNTRKLTGLTELSSDDLKELSGSVSTEKMSVQQRQKLARKRLVQIMKHKVEEVKQCSYLIENSLFLLWRHIDYYFLHCRPYDQGTTLFQLHAKKQAAMRRLQDIPGSSGAGPGDLDESTEESRSTLLKVTKEELDKLKLDSVSCINDSLFKKLQEIEQSYTKNHTRYGFMEALARRLKRLLRLHSGINNF